MKIGEVITEYSFRLMHDELLMINKALALASGVQLPINQEEREYMNELNIKLLNLRRDVTQRQIKSISDAFKKLEENRMDTQCKS